MGTKNNFLKVFTLAFLLLGMTPTGLSNPGEFREDFDGPVERAIEVENRSTDSDDMDSENLEEPPTNREQLLIFLIDSGVDPEEAIERVDSMTDEEVDEAVQMGLDALPAGGASTVTLGVGTAVALGILLLIL